MSKLSIPDDVAMLIRSLHPEIKKKVRASLERILAVHNVGKPLVEELAGLRSYRMGRIRIIYRIRPDHDVEIVAVGRRDLIYEETYRIIKRKL